MSIDCTVHPLISYLVSVSQEEEKHVNAAYDGQSRYRLPMLLAVRDVQLSATTTDTQPVNRGSYCAVEIICRTSSLVWLRYSKSLLFTLCRIFTAL